MKNIIRFSRFFLPAAILSGVIIIFGVTGFLTKGFALGVDFQAGLIQEVQFAPTAFSLRWSGTTSAILSFDRGNLFIVISGSGIENKSYTFSFNEYPTIGSLSRALTQQLEEIEVNLAARENINSQWLLFSSLGNPYLSQTPYVVHYIDPQSPPVDISEVRAAMAGIAQGFSVQNIGSPQDRHFMIRIEDKDDGRVRSDEITGLLEAHFGKGEVATLRSDYVGSRFSKDLTDQAGILLGLTLLLILLYATIRFKPQYAVGAVLAIIHDAVVVVAFVVWTRMEFTTSTIAAILTIIGYSINNTIVIFDRVRENNRIYPDSPFVDVLNISLTGVLGRTLITTLTTMLAVLSLFIFTTGSMKDFALALLVGLVSGVYTSLYVATAVVYFWENMKTKREKKKLAVAYNK
ncbi:MAG: protein translocase subunit SecF [Treponema sp.]|jgi:preprotein translocase subunit SecF|nr:protein translocase subunit SecF [Treponema sp.]